MDETNPINGITTARVFFISDGEREPRDVTVNSLGRYLTPDSYGDTQLPDWRRGGHARGLHAACSPLRTMRPSRLPLVNGGFSFAAPHSPPVDPAR